MVRFVSQMIEKVGPWDMYIGWRSIEWYGGFLSGVQWERVQ